METKICKKCGELKSVENFNKRSSSKDGFRFECKICQKKYSKVYYSKNRESILISSKKYYENNVENYRETHKQYYRDNKENILERTKLNQKNNKKIYSERSKIWVLNNSDKINLYKQKFKSKNPNYHTEYISNRRKNDSLFRLSMNIRRRLLLFLKCKNIKKNNKTFDIIGCSPQHLEQYLEQQFVEGMTWSNHGEWHIDHIIPLSSAKTEEEIYKLCHYTNLQPLWATDNLKKLNKIL
jgi:hypothetical protein